MKLAIDPGHGGTDSGAMFRGVLEKDITLNIALEVARLLQHSSNVEIMLTRTSNTTMYLGERTAKILDWHANACMSIHCNADADPDDPGMPEARGEEVFFNPGSIEGKRFAECVGWGIQNEFPNEPWRGIKDRSLHMVRMGLSPQTDPAVIIPSVLAEVAFIDNSQSNAELRNPIIRNRIALGLVKGFLRFQWRCQ